MSKKIVFDYANIVIKSGNFVKAFESLKSALLLEHSKRTGNENKLLWINIDKVKESTELVSLLHICQWTPEFNLENDIDTLKSRINLLGEDRLIFKALAPFIENDSELILYAEDESTDYKEHRYSFKNGSMYFHHCKIEISSDNVEEINIDTLTNENQSQQLKFGLSEKVQFFVLSGLLIFVCIFGYRGCTYDPEALSSIQQHYTLIQSDDLNTTSINKDLIDSYISAKFYNSSGTVIKLDKYKDDEKKENIFRQTFNISLSADYVYINKQWYISNSDKLHLTKDAAIAEINNIISNVNNYYVLKYEIKKSWDK